MITSSFFQLKIEDHIAHLILNNPDKANCMNEDFWADLPRIVRELDADPKVRVMVVSANGKHFSAGMEISSFDFIFELMKKDPARASFAMRKEILALQDSFNALEEARLPVIAVVHGACVGAGIDMITACDIRIAAADTKFSIEEINIGMAADVGTLQRLPKLIAPGIVKELSYTGRRFSPQEAEKWGLVNSVHDTQEQALEAALSMAKTIASKSPIAIAGVKHAIDYVRDHSVKDGLEQIASWNGGILKGEELVTAITARKERKEPIFADLLDPENL